MEYIKHDYMRSNACNNRDNNDVCGRHNNIDACVIGWYVEHSSRYGLGFAGGVGHHGNGNRRRSRNGECIIYDKLRRGGHYGNGADHACCHRRHGKCVPGLGNDADQQRGRRHMDDYSGYGQCNPFGFGDIDNGDRNNSGQCNGDLYDRQLRSDKNSDGSAATIGRDDNRANDSLCGLGSGVIECYERRVVECIGLNRHGGYRVDRDYHRCVGRRGIGDLRSDERRLQQFYYKAYDGEPDTRRQQRDGDTMRGRNNNHNEWHRRRHVERVLGYGVGDTCAFGSECNGDGRDSRHSLAELYDSGLLGSNSADGGPIAIGGHYNRRAECVLRRNHNINKQHCRRHLEQQRQRHGECGGVRHYGYGIGRGIGQRNDYIYHNERKLLEYSDEDNDRAVKPQRDNGNAIGMCGCGHGIISNPCGRHLEQQRTRSCQC